MQQTRVDIITNEKEERLSGTISIRIVKHGIWAIDKESGKHLCLIEIEIPKKHLKVNFTPSASFQDELLNGWLMAEKANDQFKFRNPVIDPKRPSELGKKLKHLFAVLEDWRAKHNIQLEYSGWRLK